MIVDPSVMGSNFWLQSAGDSSDAPASLAHPLTVDGRSSAADSRACVDGFYYLLKQHPELEVAILEQEICGFGASGRNGGWVSPRYPSSVTGLIEQAGPEVARRTQLELYETARELARVCAAEGIDADYMATGILMHSLRCGEAPEERCLSRNSISVRQLCRTRPRRAQSTPEPRRARRVRQGRRGLRSHAHHGRRNPASRQARARSGPGRANVGGVIYEKTAVTDICPDGRLMTEVGEVQARKTVVVAAEAYLSRFPAYRRTLVPISSTIILTEPLTEAQWADIGWAGREGMSSQGASRRN